MNELESILAKLKETSPGYDNITYKMIINAPNNAKKVLLKCFNDSWSSGSFHRDWKTQIIVPILKANKDRNEANSYRPIALSSCVAKILEHLIKIRLEWYCEHYKLLPSSQFGFRKARGTMDNLCTLTTEINEAFGSNQYLIALFLDLSSAYDKVQIPILHKKLLRLGFPLKFVSILSKYLTDRILYLRTDEGMEGPRLSNIGLPQGCVLSPILFTLYTADLENYLRLIIKILQYADDVCLYLKVANIRAGIRKFEQVFQKLMQWLSENGLDLSITKTNFTIFTRKKISPPINSITINNIIFPVVANVKFLGVYLDQKLLWVHHIESLVARCEKNLNILRVISSTWFGADASLLLICYRAFIRSILDYGCILYGNASKTHLYKIDKIQYKALRICLGAMKSTPTNALLVEAAEPPLHFRRELLCRKFLLCRMSEENNNLIKNVNHLMVNCLTKQYWVSKTMPLLVHSYLSLTNFQNKITKTRQVPAFKYPYAYSFKNILINFEIAKDASTSREFEVNLNEKYHGWLRVYTDGSKIDEKVGSAFFCPKYNEYGQYKLPSEATINTAETIAILKAVIYAHNKTDPRIVILCDSQSVLKQIEHIQWNAKSSEYIMEIMHGIHILENEGKITEFVWAKAHIGIPGNEKVDILAKEATTSGINLELQSTPTDLQVIQKENMYKQWQEEWNATKELKGKAYSLVQPLIQKKPWFHKQNISRRYVSSISRARLNHGSFPQHLHKIKVIQSPYCDCDPNQVADIDHIFWTCSKYNNQRSTLIHRFNSAGLYLPMQDREYLVMRDKHCLEAIIQFLTDTKIKI